LSSVWSVTPRDSLRLLPLLRQFHSARVNLSLLVQRQIEMGIVLMRHWVIRRCLRTGTLGRSGLGNETELARYPFRRARTYTPNRAVPPMSEAPDAMNGTPASMAAHRPRTVLLSSITFFIIFTQTCIIISFASCCSQGRSERRKDSGGQGKRPQLSAKPDDSSSIFPFVQGPRTGMQTIALIQLMF
jgi:hypothetical protein